MCTLPGCVLKRVRIQAGGYCTLNCGKLGLEGRSRLPALKGGRGVCQKSRDQTRKKDKYYLTRICIQNQPQEGLIHIREHPWVLGQATGTWTHLTHHGPDSGEATTFPHIVFFAALSGGYIQMALFPGTPKGESRNYPGLESRDFGKSYFPVPTSDWSLNQSCSSPQELSNTMSHSFSRCLEDVDSRLLVVGSQTTNLTPGPFFAHNLG